jgi:phosphoglycolate phosphatase
MQHCIFDLDGTLFDSSNQILNAISITRESNKLKKLSVDEIKRRIGLPATYLFEDVDESDQAIQNLVREFRENLRREIVKSNPLFPGVLNFINFLFEMNIRLSVATTKPTDLAEWTIVNSPLVDRIFNIQGTDNFPAKPNPQVLINCHIRDNESNTFMFGDRVEDVHAALSANLIAVGIAQSVHSVDVLKNAGAKFVFKSFEEFENIIATLNLTNESLY